MNIYDTDAKSKLAAISLIETLHGLSISAADNQLGLVELSIINGHMYPHHSIESLRDKIKGLPSGSALNAVRYARYVIMNHTEVDMNAEGTAMAFALWAKEAALAGTRMTA